MMNLPLPAALEKWSGEWSAIRSASVSDGYAIGLLHSAPSMCSVNSDSYVSSISVEERCSSDKAIRTNPSLNEKRRTLVIARSSLDVSFGFALQSYVLKRSAKSCTERITYVDYVGDGSPAAKAGIRRGDVVIAINGVSVVHESHTSLVKMINSFLSMRIVVVFQDIARMIQLSARSLQLQYILREKEYLLAKLEEEEQNVKNGLLRLVKPGTDISISYTDSDSVVCSSIEADASSVPEDPMPRRNSAAISELSVCEVTRL